MLKSVGYPKIMSQTSEAKIITKKNALTTLSELVVQQLFTRLLGKLNYS